MYQPPALPELLTPYNAFVDPVSGKPAVVFWMRFTTHGSNVRTARLIDVISQRWFPKPEGSTVNVPIREGDDYNAANLLAIILPLTARVDFHWDVLDSTSLRAFAWFWDWLGRDVYLDAERREELHSDPDRIEAIWELFGSTVDTKIQTEWRKAFAAGQTVYPPSNEMRIMSAEQEKQLEKTNPDFLAEEKQPAANSE